MRYVLTLCALCALSLTASADTITTTDGKSYTKAADGHYYPSAHVTQTGAVVTAAPTVRPAVYALPSYAPQYLPAYPFPAQTCPSGKCPLK